MTGEASPWPAYVAGVLDHLERTAVPFGSGAIAGVGVAIGTGDDALAALLGPALALGEGVGDPPALRLLAGGGDVEPPPFGPADLRPRDEVAGASGDGVEVAWAVERQVLWLWHAGSGRGGLWCRDPGRLAPWDASAPFRPVLAWALPDVGRHVVHAAAVSPPGSRGVLLVGRGGSGKSTTTGACAMAGWAVAGDDDVVVHRHGPGWRASPLYRWIKLSAASLDVLGLRLRPAAERGVDHRGKRRIDLATAFGPPAPVDVGAVVLPRVADRTGRPVPIRPAVALAAVAPSTALQLPGRRSTTMSALADLVRSVPAFTLDVGPDVAAAGPAALAEVVG